MTFHAFSEVFCVDLLLRHAPRNTEDFEGIRGIFSNDNFDASRSYYPIHFFSENQPSYIRSGQCPLGTDRPKIKNNKCRFLETILSSVCRFPSLKIKKKIFFDKVTKSGKKKSSTV